MRWQTTEWEKIFAKDTLDRELLSNTYKELLKLHKEINNPIKTWAKDQLTQGTNEKEAYEKMLSTLCCKGIAN